MNVARMTHVVLHLGWIAQVVFLALLVSRPDAAGAQADGDTDRRIAELESKVDHLQSEVTDVQQAAGVGFFVSFLFGMVLAMWAQRRGRSGCAW